MKKSTQGRILLLLAVAGMNLGTASVYAKAPDRKAVEYIVPGVAATGLLANTIEMFSSKAKSQKTAQILFGRYKNKSFFRRLFTDGETALTAARFYLINLGCLGVLVWDIVRDRGVVVPEGAKLTDANGNQIVMPTVDENGKPLPVVSVEEVRGLVSAAEAPVVEAVPAAVPVDSAAPVVEPNPINVSVDNTVQPVQKPQRQIPTPPAVDAASTLPSTAAPERAPADAPVVDSPAQAGESSPIAVEVNSDASVKTATPVSTDEAPVVAPIPAPSQSDALDSGQGLLLEPAVASVEVQKTEEGREAAGSEQKSEAATEEDASVSLSGVIAGEVVPTKPVDQLVSTLPSTAVSVSEADEHDKNAVAKKVIADMQSDDFNNKSGMMSDKQERFETHGQVVSTTTPNDASLASGSKSSFGFENILEVRSNVVGEVHPETHPEAQATEEEALPVEEAGNNDRSSGGYSDSLLKFVASTSEEKEVDVSSASSVEPVKTPILPMSGLAKHDAEKPAEMQKLRERRNSQASTSSQPRAQSPAPVEVAAKPAIANEAAIADSDASSTAVLGFVLKSAEDAPQNTVLSSPPVVAEAPVPSVANQSPSSPVSMPNDASSVKESDAIKSSADALTPPTSVPSVKAKGKRSRSSAVRRDEH